MNKGFFAYSSEPKYCGEFIEEAIKNINESYSGITEIKSWKKLKIAGKLVIGEILNEIDNCDYFCADLTGMNDNVLFELGYAISIGKPIWVIFDTSHIDSIKNYRELGLISTIGYSDYKSSKNIIQKFTEDEIYKKEDSIFNQLVENVQSTENENVLFYLKSLYDTNYSQEIVNAIQYHKLPYLLDDPEETKSHPLTWYIEKIFTTPSVLIEFSSTYRHGYEIHNSKCAFISGLSVGLGLRVLMVCEQPYETPIDYRELLVRFSTRDECHYEVNKFIQSIKDDAAELLLRKKRKDLKHRERTELQKINFGEFIAEHESENLFDYFVETSHSQNIVKSEHNIVVGRKGTGKTATLYFLQKNLNRDVRNHICLIKPVNFEMDGILSLLKKMHDEFEKGYMIESIWKFLIYTEITKSLYERIKKTPNLVIDEERDKFVEYVDNNREIILTDFSTRLEQEIEKLSSIKEVTQKDFRIKVSEILHGNLLVELKHRIVKNIKKNGKLVVLIDNLDKSWRKESDFESLSKFILGLLGVVGRIARDFHSKPIEDYKFSFHLTIFLRSDIFKSVMSAAREPDKIEFTRLKWDDKETLFRMIESRFEKLTELEVIETDLWGKYVVRKIDGQSTKDFIMNNIFPRPRDLIYFLTSAKNFAVSRGHIKIGEDDLKSALEDYSNWIFKSLIVENGITVEQMEEFMYNLLGKEQIITEESLREIAENSEIKFDSDEDFERFIDHLVSLTILGREVKKSNFQFEFGFNDEIKFKKLAEKRSDKKYMIHNALKPFLELN